MGHKPAGVVPDPKPVTYRLPLTISGPADVTQLVREAESLENYLRQAAARGGEIRMPKTSRALEDVVTLNKLDMLKTSDRQMLLAFLKVLHSKAPVLHISFGVEPSSAFVGKILTWLRANISPFMLVRIGKQPTIGGGCVVRATNKQFDFSFRQYMDAKRDVLAKSLAEVSARAKASQS